MSKPRVYTYDDIPMLEALARVGCLTENQSTQLAALRAEDALTDWYACPTCGKPESVAPDGVEPECFECTYLEQ